MCHTTTILPVHVPMKPVVPCPACDGRGYVLDFNSFDCGSDGPSYWRCPKCHGTKEIEVKP